MSFRDNNRSICICKDSFIKFFNVQHSRWKSWRVIVSRMNSKISRQSENFHNFANYRQKFLPSASAKRFKISTMCPFYCFSNAIYRMLLHLWLYVQMNFPLLCAKNSQERHHDRFKTSNVSCICSCKTFVPLRTVNGLDLQNISYFIYLSNPWCHLFLFHVLRNFEARLSCVKKTTATCHWNSNAAIF